MLKLIAEDPAIAAKRGAQARRLWAVCGLPDFRKVGPMHHARMVRRLFSYIEEGGHVPHEWFAAEVTRLDNVSGDIEALADRLAGIRSWAYIAHRADWLADPAKWAERTREVESRLSDALHERLTQRFVDRRTAVLVRDIGARGADALPVTVTADGEVSVGPEPIGHLTGFDFRVDPSARFADKRLLLAAAERRLGEELDRRANALVDAPDDAFELVVEESGGLAVALAGPRACPPCPGSARCSSRRCAPRARSTACRRKAGPRCAPGSSAGSMRRSTAISSRSRSSPPRRPIPPARPACARSRRCSPTPAGSSRARRCSAPSRISSRPTARRCTSCGSASARSTSSCRRCSSPRAQQWRAALLAVRTGSPMPALPPPGAATLGAEADPRGAALAYRRLGREWIRIDLADRLASHARKVRSAGGEDPVDAALATSIGLERGRHRPADGRSRLHQGRRRVALARPPPAAPGPRGPRRPTPSPSWPSSKK